MGVTPVMRRRAKHGRLRASSRRRAITPAEAAWIAVAPCALLTLAAIVVLGPLLGEALLQPDPAREAFWPVIGAVPWPAQRGRFLTGLLGPPLLVATVLASAHPRVQAGLRLHDGAIRMLVIVGQAALATFVLVCFAAQHDVVLSADFVQSPHFEYFTWPTLLVALALPLPALALLRHERVERFLRRQLRETPARRVLCLIAAALYAAIWLLTAINLDSSIGNTNPAVWRHLAWTIDEPFAVLDDRTPLVDFHAQYGQVWAYLAAAPMALLGPTVGTYSITMAATSGLVLLAVYATFRRIVRSSLLGLALFVPFLATTGFTVLGPVDDRFGSLNLYLLWPIRYGGPFLLAWLTARHVDHASPRHTAIIGAVIGLVSLNSMDFGLASGAATVAALACAQPPRPGRAVRRLIGETLVGLLAAAGLVVLLTLLRSGSLPQPTLLFEFGRLYAIGGWAQLPMPEVGLHLAVLLVFAAALVTAVVRVASADEDRLMTAMLAWIGVFGLAVSVYYGARAHPFALVYLFGPWAFAVALLTVVAMRALAARGWRRPALPQLAILFAFGLLVCSLPQTPAPGPQLDRIRDRTAAPILRQRGLVRFLEATTRPGEQVVVLPELSHRAAYDAGVVNVSPYTSIAAMPTRQQLQRTIDALRAAGGRKLYASLLPGPEALQMLEDAGFVVQRSSRTGAFLQLVDARR
jgi:hypothetical protein